ncbi:hypothetical protein [Streptomyces sp. H27-C3]|uniref:hypothetical protein n=1 Tax=Streptomyces sp. H27-C3 TaxID=3046305 RepID=UPI0024B919C3|nr:hypothetical protein [Streptomyces sp. H27-C3]MDJ0466258.1 hypothetical protein [Streptomyces sp. H27-C3]
MVGPALTGALITGLGPGPVMPVGTARYATTKAVLCLMRPGEITGSPLSAGARPGLPTGRRLRAADSA